MIQSLKVDLEISTNRKARFPLLAILMEMIKNSGYRAVVLYRLGHSCRKRKWRLLAVLCEKIMHHASNCWISTNAIIAEGFVIRHVGCIVIGGLVKIGRNCDIRQGITIGGNMGKTNELGNSQPVLGDNILIGAGAKILGPVHIGDNCVIGANAVVIGSFEPNSIIGGVPARLLKSKDITI